MVTDILEPGLLCGHGRTQRRNKEASVKYIKNQLEEEQFAGQIIMKEYLAPFTGEPVKEGK